MQFQLRYGEKHNPSLKLELVDSFGSEVYIADFYGGNFSHKQEVAAKQIVDLLNGHIDELDDNLLDILSV